MAVFDLFSKRQKKLRGEVPTVYTYDQLPEQLRVQIILIIQDTLGVNRRGSYGEYTSEKAYEFLHKSIAREYGKFGLAGTGLSNKESLLNSLLHTEESEKAIDIIELTFKLIDAVIRKDYYIYMQHNKLEMAPDDAIDELNQRFKEHGVGYQFEGGEIIKVDSSYTHSEIVKPAITLLWNSKFIGANEEYLMAHQHYRHGRNKECLTECSKAFESVMKIICKEKGWQYQETDTASKLIQLCFQNGLVPAFTQNQFTSLQNLLISGIP